MKPSRKRRSLALTIIVFAIAIALWSARLTVHKACADGARASLPALSAEREPTGAAAHGLRAEMPALGLANFPLAFEANAGQADPSVKFLARAGRSELLLTSRSVVVQSRKSLGVKFVGSNAASKPQGKDVLP